MFRIKNEKKVVAGDRVILINQKNVTDMAHQEAIESK
jgi:hypothetical protein